MNRELCFRIDNKDIYMEQSLVEYMDIPIYFLCKAERQFYIVLCTDIEELTYLVEKISYKNVFDLIHGNIPMRDVFYQEQEYWEIISGEEIEEDTIVKKSVDCIDESVLPEAGACFKALTEEVASFIQKFDELYSDLKYYDHFDYITTKGTQIFLEMSEGREKVEVFENIGNYILLQKMTTVPNDSDHIEQKNYQEIMTLKTDVKVQSEDWKNSETLYIAA